ncbi:hypothetical protein BDY21DRAFT_354589 [Lineolata rhizophorae]|uniref:Uncharacterized protein n=1 Tax=Lineolata rhizophorae TaxID=578093 RepID=A0A6A6NQ65_9PEZI|nr:hypothetical protein BDY21DRAFT_354589 [Lineolata rhizophorae]
MLFAFFSFAFVAGTRESQRDHTTRPRHFSLASENLLGIPASPSRTYIPTYIHTFAQPPQPIAHTPTPSSQGQPPRTLFVADADGDARPRHDPGINYASCPVRPVLLVNFTWFPHHTQQILPSPFLIPSRWSDPKFKPRVFRTVWVMLPPIHTCSIGYRGLIGIKSVSFKY